MGLVHRGRTETDDVGAVLLDELKSHLVESRENLLLLSVQEVPAVGMGVDGADAGTSILHGELAQRPLVEPKPSLPHREHPEPSTKHERRDEHGLAGCDHRDGQQRAQGGDTRVADGVDADGVEPLLFCLHARLEQGDVGQHVVVRGHITGRGGPRRSVVKLDRWRQLRLFLLFRPLLQLL